MKLRSDDPAAMKDFILSVQDRVNTLKTSTVNGTPMIDSRRVYTFSHCSSRSILSVNACIEIIYLMLNFSADGVHVRNNLRD